MRIPLISHIHKLIEEKDEDYIHETMEVLEHIADSSGIKDEELEVIGELLSNLSGALAVQQSIDAGSTKKEALNHFMKRVMGSIA